MSKKVSQLQPVAKPLVSFCISTYKRQQFIKQMLKEILKQTYPNFEVIICDNDPAGSSKKAVTSFKSDKIKYHVNPRNLGMVKSFNRAFKLSKGDLIVFVSDDDPPYPHMLTELVELYQQYPECGAFFAAYDLYTPDTTLAQTIAMPTGKLSCRNQDWPDKAVKIFTPGEYLKKGLDGDIFYYLMWSTGIVKREIVEKVGAIPSYGSALMTDRSYCLKVGAKHPTLIYNHEVGIQTVHNQSFSLTLADSDILVQGFVGYYQDIQPYLKRYDLEKENQSFLLRHLVNMFMIIKVGDEVRRQPTDVSFLMGVFDQIAAELPFLIKYRAIMRLMLWRRWPFEIMFKVTQLPPQKLIKTIRHFVWYRLIRKPST